MERYTVEQGRTETTDVSPFDEPSDRPGVPMEAAPAPDEDAHWTEPAVQIGAQKHLRRAGLEQPTPVVGTGQPPHGVSGLIRRAAYRIPERFARHWLLLLVADRVDVLEDRVAPLLAKPLERLGFGKGARFARANPLGALAGVAAGMWLTSRVLGDGRGRRVRSSATRIPVS